MKEFLLRYISKGWRCLERKVFKCVIIRDFKGDIKIIIYYFFLIKKISY